MDSGFSSVASHHQMRSLLALTIAIGRTSSSYWVSRRAPEIERDKLVSQLHAPEESRGAALSLVRDLEKLIDKEAPSAARDDHVCQAKYLRLLIEKDDFHLTSTSAPWLSESWPSVMVPSTTECELQQMLVWLVRELRCKTVVEVGCWLGHTTLLLARSLDPRGGRVIALDAFRWQSWMNEYVYSSDRMETGVSFKEVFQKNVKGNEHNVQTFEVNCEAGLDMQGWSYGPMDLVFIDFSRTAVELSRMWDCLEEQMVDGHTLVVVNGYGQPGVCTFLHQHHDDLRPLHKPHTGCKAFRFERNWCLPECTKVTQSPGDGDCKDDDIRSNASICSTWL